jgi:hypothetical protein
MPIFSEVKLPGKQQKKPKQVFHLEPAESSFIIKPDNRAQINQLQSVLLSYSDDAEQQIARALAAKEPADKYDFKLQQEILQGTLGFKAKL